MRQVSLLLAGSLKVRVRFVEFLAHRGELLPELLHLFVVGVLYIHEVVPSLANGANQFIRLSCIAFASRFCVFWIRKTIRKVTIVVPVLMTSCQVSDQWKNGPVMAQIATTDTPRTNAPGEPQASAVQQANFRNRSTSRSH